MPELKATTGILALVAAATASSRASCVTRVVAMPSTRLSTAFWMSTACLSGCGSLEYFSVTLSLAAAAFAPALILSQNVSPGVSCVIIAMVSRGVFATPAATPLVCGVLAFLPPELLHPVTARAATAATATSRVIVRDRVDLICDSFRGAQPLGRAVGGLVVRFLRPAG